MNAHQVIFILFQVIFYKFNQSQEKIIWIKFIFLPTASLTTAHEGQSLWRHRALNSIHYNFVNMLVNWNNWRNTYTASWKGEPAEISKFKALQCAWWILTSVVSYSSSRAYLDAFFEMEANYTINPSIASKLSWVVIACLLISFCLIDLVVSDEE